MNKKQITVMTILTLVLAFMDISGLPAVLFVHYSLSDDESAGKFSDHRISRMACPENLWKRLAAWTSYFGANRGIKKVRFCGRCSGYSFLRCIYHWACTF